MGDGVQNEKDVGAMKIDVHAHYWPMDYIDLLVDLAKSTLAVYDGIGAGDGAERGRQAALIERAESKFRYCLPLSLRSIATKMGEDRTKAAQFANDLYADLVWEHSRHFRAFATLPLPHVDESIAEMGRALDELQMVGVEMSTTVLGRALVEPDFEPVWSELNSRSAVLYLPPPGSGAGSPLISDFHLTWLVGAPVEDTISVTHLITNGFPTGTANIKIINSHLGGALPMLVQRADDQYRWEELGTPELPGAAARRMWYDTVGHGHVPALSCAIESFGPDRLLLGTDFPFETGDEFSGGGPHQRRPGRRTCRPGDPRQKRKRSARDLVNAKENLDVPVQSWSTVRKPARLRRHEVERAGRV